MATTPTRLMTFEEFEKLPDHPHGYRCELRHGEPVFVPPPIHGHNVTQRRLLDLLRRTSGKVGEVNMEVGFRPLNDHEYRVADVAFVARDRWNSIPWRGNLSGSPDLVIEVLSPSNTATGIRDKRKLCLETGSWEFWTVDLDLRQVEVSVAGGQSTTYKSGQEIPLFFLENLGGGRLAVDEIFS